MTQPGRPEVDPRQVRPRRAWYTVAGVIAAVGVLAGVVLIVLAVKGFGSLTGAFPEPIAEFEGTEPAPVQLTAAKQWALFMDGPGPPSGSPSVSDPPTVSARCTGRALGGGTVDLTQPSYSYSSSASGGRTWYLLYEVHVSRDGRYEFTCTSDDPGTGSGRYAVGEAPDVGGFVANLLGGFVGTFGAIGCPCTAILVATVIIVITSVRRNAYRRRLRFLPNAGYGMRAGPAGRRAWGPGDDRQDRV